MDLQLVRLVHYLRCLDRTGQSECQQELEEEVADSFLVVLDSVGTEKAYSDLLDTVQQVFASVGEEPEEFQELLWDIADFEGSKVESQV
eukprot:CAMPEP_0197012008 /NCGR_PEP_ID=MMETSP1380-20130617/60894_1 /TAXON_ID=5936 /ORGANISM="Euplotes crassus, Strain CT5" /LENGTH=88 /DNA_ID=CAMNT_0042435177 /DNA_START=262 /DNA_END=525 /DNA_ORIENTATION=+